MNTVHVRVRAGGEHYALPVHDITEVTDVGDVTPVPGADANVMGVRNLRGQIVPVVDFAALLGLGTEAAPERLVVAEDGDRRVALAVQAVVDVGPMPSSTEAVESAYLAGAAFVDGDLVGIVDIVAALDALTGSQAG